MILGGFIIGTWGGFKNKFYSMVTSNFIIALCTIALGIVPFFYVYLGFLLLCGLVLPLFNVPATVLIQSKVDKEYLGRVFGVFNMVSSIMMPLGMLLFGPLSDKININYLLIATGILMLILSFIMTSSKVMIEAGKPNNIVNENNK
jgi:DHA3 family macrolide efflux protein-like MFS transporter